MVVEAVEVEADGEVGRNWTSRQASSNGCTKGDSQDLPITGRLETGNI